jgi:hypothetical protein
VLALAALVYADESFEEITNLTSFTTTTLFREQKPCQP